MSKLRPRQPARRRCRLRRVKPGTAYLITKKTSDDLFWIVASPEMNALLLYTLILWARRYGVLIHAFCFMSNHVHLLVTDVRGELPAFMGQFLTETSKAIKVLLGETRRIWSGKRYSAVALLDLDAAERKVAYCMLNPTRAGLTDPIVWPGVTSAHWRFGDTITAQRPAVYFSPRYRPDEVSIELSPVAFAFPTANGEEQGRACEESNVRVEALVESELESIHRDLERRGQSLAGPERVRNTPRDQRGSHPVRTLNPNFATQDKVLLATGIAEKRQFESDHERARRRYVAGHTRTVFPPGTYGYRVLLGVRVGWDGAAA
ncbi:MAG: transposase [Planctomycetota bacterium]